MYLIAMLLVTLTPLATVCQMEIDCAFPNATVLESLYNYTDFGEGSGSPSVNVTTFHPVCLAHSQERNRYRFASVVVEYAIMYCSDESCTMSTETHRQQQIDIECVEGVWEINSMDTNLIANSLSTTREDCAFCLSPQNSVGASIVIDNITHCAGKT